MNLAATGHDQLQKHGHEEATETSMYSKTIMVFSSCRHAPYLQAITVLQ